MAATMHASRPQRVVMLTALLAVGAVLLAVPRVMGQYDDEEPDVVEEDEEDNVENPDSASGKAASVDGHDEPTEEEEPTEPPPKAARTANAQSTSGQPSPLHRFACLAVFPRCKP